MDFYKECLQGLESASERFEFLSGELEQVANRLFLTDFALDPSLFCERVIDEMLKPHLLSLMALSEALKYCGELSLQEKQKPSAATINRSDKNRLKAYEEAEQKLIAEYWNLPISDFTQRLKELAELHNV